VRTRCSEAVFKRVQSPACEPQPFGRSPARRQGRAIQGATPVELVNSLHRRLRQAYYFWHLIFCANVYACPFRVGLGACIWRMHP
jgi:hypothetical protein